MLGSSSAVSGVSDIKMEMLYWKFNGKSSAVHRNPKELPGSVQDHNLLGLKSRICNEGAQNPINRDIFLMSWNTKCKITFCNLNGSIFRGWALPYCCWHLYLKCWLVCLTWGSNHTWPNPPALLLGKQPSFLKLQASKILLEMQVFLSWDNLGKEKAEKFSKAL